jgi:hypothetical protein
VAGDLIYDQLVSTRGPVRHVCPSQAEDVRLVRGALMMAGQQAMTTLAVALLHGFRAGERHTGHPGALIAGRPGSSESQVVRGLAWEIGPDVALARVHGAALEILDGVAGGFEKVADAPLQRSPHARRYANYATARVRYRPSCEVVNLPVAKGTSPIPVRTLKDMTTAPNGSSRTTTAP